MIPRKFYLRNTNGETYNLLKRSYDNPNGPLFFEPDGLGFEESADWLRMGTTFRPVNITQAQRTISGKLYFLDEDKAYEGYYNFIRFIHNQPLVMTYTAYDTFQIDVRVQSIEKTEINQYGVLECKVKFVALGPFYKMVRRKYERPKDPSEPRRLVTHYGEPISDGAEHVLIAKGPNRYETYEYVYDDVYPDEPEDSIDISIPVAVADSPARLVIYGPCVNPTWQHYVNNKFVASGKYNGTLEENHRLVIDAMSMPYRIFELTQEYAIGTEDRYGRCDFTTERFLFMREGQNKIVVNHEGTSRLNFDVEVKLCYESV